MNNVEIANTLEYMRRKQINLVNSKEYRLGIKAIRFINDIKTHKIFTAIKREIKYRQIAKYNYKVDIPMDNFIYGDYPPCKKKFIVYTCVTGGYDTIQEPLYNHPSIDYVLFTDNPNLTSSVWNIRQIPDYIANLNNNILINRYIKLNPHNLFNGYDYSLYVDGNIIIVSDIRNMINRINDITGLALHRHSSRRCIYKEAEVCKIEHRGNYRLILEQIRKYQNEGFPDDFGLYEATVILTDLSKQTSKDILNKWWTEFLNSKSFRDQIALPYVIWKYGYKFDDIGNLGINLHNSPKFEKVIHKQEA